MAGPDRIALAGGKPTGVVQVGCELQRDWSSQETADGFTQMLFGGERPLAGASTEPAGNGVHAGQQDVDRTDFKPMFERE